MRYLAILFVGLVFFANAQVNVVSSNATDGFNVDELKAEINLSLK